MHMPKASPIEHIRLSQEARDRLVHLKRRTGIAHWNTLCRWAFCRSLVEPNPPPRVHIPADSSVEMTWRVFGGPYSDVFLTLLRMRCARDGFPLDDDSLASEFRRHLHRGIAYLQADRKLTDIAALVTMAPPSE